MFKKLEKYQINGNIVASVTGFQVDASDPENIVILETANIDGSNTMGGVWFIDRILSDRLSGSRQMLNALTDNAIEVGNSDLEELYLMGSSSFSVKVKYGSNEEHVWHSGNFDPGQYVLQSELDVEIPDWSEILNNQTIF